MTLYIILWMVIVLYGFTVWYYLPTEKRRLSKLKEEDLDFIIKNKIVQIDKQIEEAEEIIK